MKRPLIVSDSGPLIALAGCSLLDLLPELFGIIHIPQAVLDETTANQTLPGACAIASFVDTHAAVLVHPDRQDEFQASIATYLDEGEAQALSLAHELKCGVLMDERRGRQAAARLGIQRVGVLGVLLEAKALGKLQCIAPFIQTMRENGYHVSDRLIESVLSRAGETSRPDE